MKRFKMPTAFTIIFILIIVVAILTWFIPAGTYNYVDPDASTLQPIAGTYHSIDSNPQGIWEILYAFISGFYDAVDIELFVLVIGGFLAVIMKSGAIDAGIGHVIERLRGNDIMMIPILMILLGIGGTTYGMCEETIAFYPMIIAVFIAAGYDVLTPVAVIAIGAGVGCLGSTINPFSIGTASGFADISIGDGLFLRFVILVVSMAVSIAYVMHYADKVKKDPSKSLVYEMKAENEEHFVGSTFERKVDFTRKRKGILILFGLTFLIMILGVIPWSYKFNISIFANLNDFIIGIPVLGKLLGNVVALGDWWFGEMTLLFLTAAIIAAWVYGFKEDEFMETFVNGAKDLLGVAMIIGLSRGITIVMNDGNITATILHYGENALANLGPLGFTNLTYLFYIPLSFLVQSSSGLSTLSMPIIAPLADFANVDRNIAITAFATANGVVNLITPTSAVIMGALSIARVNYAKYFKFMWKLLILLMLISMAAMSVAVIL